MSIVVEHRPELHQLCKWALVERIDGKKRLTLGLWATEEDARAAATVFYGEEAEWGKVEAHREG